MRVKKPLLQNCSQPSGPAEMLNAKWRVLSSICIVHLACCISGCKGSAPSQKQTAQNVVLITIDTLRADHVGAYGSTRAQTPALDALARDGVVFDRAYAAAPITLPSHA